MPGLEIPEEHERGLKKLYGLSERQANDLLSEVESAAKLSDNGIVDPENLHEVEGLAKTDRDDIVETVLSLHRVRAFAEVSADEFVSDVCDALAGGKTFRLESASRDAFGSRLSKFIAIKELRQAAKARLLRDEHERSLHDLRILTDARPIFEEEQVEPPDRAVIFHMLKISFHDADRVAETFFSLDEADLEYLKKTIERAELKAKSLRESLRQANIKVIDFR